MTRKFKKEAQEVRFIIDPQEIIKDIQPQRSGKRLDRIIYIVGNLDENLAREVNERLLDYQAEAPLKEITLILDCYGGEVDSMFAVTDMMNIIMSPIRTICIGKAMSAAAFIFINGKKGRRFMTPHSRLMFHQISSWHGGTLADVVIDTEEIKFLQNQMVEEIAMRSKLSSKEVIKLIDRNTYLRPEEAIKLGMCDGLIKRLN
ncbi:MAG TPA: ATP-dependent Clp protease proteolytic subunit [Bacteroidales bacterium]|nr:ATP-dependent Clp protease proteolytic subunit [Bacteroidales bacterium]